MGRGRCWGSLGHLAHDRFKKARASKKPQEDLLRYLNDAHQSYQRALALFPPNAVHELATTHNALGNVYRYANDIDRALAHYREAIRYCEIMGDLYLAGGYRKNVAYALAEAGRLSDGRDYAQASLRNFEPYGESAVADIQETRELIAKIEQAMRSQG